jgi:Tfp pilus assembly protein PilF
MIWTAVVLAAAVTAAEKPAPAPESADEAIHSGLAAFKTKKFARAEAEFGKAVEADPGSAAAHYYLGYTIYKRVEPKRPFHPDKQKAASEFAKAYELDPGFTPEWGGKGTGKTKAVAKADSGK